MTATETVLAAIADNWGGVGCSRSTNEDGVLRFSSREGDRYAAFPPGTRFPCFEDSGRPCGTRKVPARTVFVRCLTDAPDGWFEVRFDDERIAVAVAETARVAALTPAERYEELTEWIDECSQAHAEIMAEHRSETAAFGDSWPGAQLQIAAGDRQLAAYEAELADLVAEHPELAPPPPLTLAERQALDAAYPEPF